MRQLHELAHKTPPKCDVCGTDCATCVQRWYSETAPLDAGTSTSSPGQDHSTRSGITAEQSRIQELLRKELETSQLLKKLVEQDDHQKVVQGAITTANFAGLSESEKVVLAKPQELLPEELDTQAEQFNPQEGTNSTNQHQQKITPEISKHRQKRDAGEMLDGAPAVKRARIFECSKCEKVYKSKAALDSHIMGIHTGERPFVCSYPECGKSFYDRPNLINHQKSHEKPFICSECDRRFGRKEHLKNHKKKKH